jgi:hypothetical protein
LRGEEESKKGQLKAGGATSVPAIARGRRRWEQIFRRRELGRFLPVVEEVWAVRPAGRHLLFFLLDWFFFL